MSLPLEEITEGKYEILGKIAVGGVGSIYKVRHRLLDEIRVIKVLRRQHSESKKAQRRFLQEAKTAISLKHPNIAQIYDFAVSQDGAAYIVMEFIDGVGLDKVISTCGPPSLPLSLELAQQTLRAIGYLHSRRFVHRDISPDNLMLTRAYDDSPLIKIIDLGIVKNLASDSQMTVAGMFLGKARYSSPEQFSGSESVSVDHRTDTYSFGVVLYELLTGVCPIRGETFPELAAGHLFGTPLDFEESDPEGRVPQPVRKLVMKTLEKSPTARPSLAELARLLDDFRDSSQVSGSEFREIFVRAFSGMAKPEASRTEGTTQGHMDHEFGIDETTASGTTTGEAEKLTAATAKAGAVQREQISVEVPSVESPTERIRAPLPSEPAPSEPREEKWTAPEGGGSIPRHWTILAPVAAFLIAAVGGYFWLREAPPPVQTIRVERPPVFARSPTTRTTTTEELRAVGSPPGDAVLTAGPGVTPPRANLRPSPRYPPDARRLARGATVVVAVLVDKTGRVSQARIVQGDSSNLGFEEAAMEAARGTTFTPANQSGEAGEMWTELRFVFEP